MLDDFSEDLAAGLDELGGSDAISLLLAEDGLEGSDADVLRPGDVNLSGNCGGFVEEPVGVDGVGVIAVAGLDEGGPLKFKKALYLGEFYQISFLEEFGHLLDEKVGRAVQDVVALSVLVNVHASNLSLQSKIPLTQSLYLYKNINLMFNYLIAKRTKE